MFPFDASFPYRIPQSPAISPSISPQDVASPDSAGRYCSVKDSVGWTGEMRLDKAVCTPVPSAPLQRSLLAPTLRSDLAAPTAPPAPDADAPTPAQLAAEGLQYQALREAAAGQLYGLAQYFLSDGRAADVTLSALHMRCQAMTSGVLSGVSPFSIEWDGELKTGTVVAFLQWLVAQPMSQVVHALRMSCVTATATHLAPILQNAGMVAPERPEPAYVMCRLIAGLFAVDERAQSSLHRRLNAADADRLLAQVYFRGAKHTLAELQHAIVHIEAHRAVTLLTARQQDMQSVDSFAAVIAKALTTYCQRGGSIADVFFELGAQPHHVEAFKRALVFYKAEHWVERAFAAGVAK